MCVSSRVSNCAQISIEKPEINSNICEPGPQTSHKGQCFEIEIYLGFPVAQMVEHGASNTKIMGSIPRESKSWSKVKKTVTWMQCKSLWIKASAKCINVIIVNLG